MFEHRGEKYFIVDSHLHMWSAGPDNWKPGAEQYAKGWIECFHAYMGLGPPETHWPLEKFMSYTHDDFVHDVFEEGGVDYGIFQSTYLREWYTNGFNTAAQNAELLEKYPDRLIVNGRFDPRDGTAGSTSAIRASRCARNGCRSTPSKAWRVKCAKPIRSA